MTKNAVILLSGGLDSATCLAIAKGEGFTCRCLSFQYGQRHLAELDAAQKVAEAFGAAEHLVPVLGFAYVLRSFADFFAIPITYAYQTKRIAAIRITAAILCLGLYAVLIPRWTTFGAAYATVGVFAYLLFLLYRFGQRATRHDYHVGSLLRVVLVAAVVIVASRSLDMHPGWLRLGTMSLITLAFPFVAAPRETLSLVHEARGKLTAWRGRAS